MIAVIEKFSPPEAWIISADRPDRLTDQVERIIDRIVIPDTWVRMMVTKDVRTFGAYTVQFYDSNAIINVRSLHGIRLEADQHDLSSKCVRVNERADQSVTETRINDGRAL